MFVNDWLKPLLEKADVTKKSWTSIKDFFKDQKSNSTCRFIEPCNALNVLRELVCNCEFNAGYRMNHYLKSFDQPEEQKDTLELVKESVS